MNEQERKRATYTGTISVFAFLSFDQPITQPNCKKWNSHKSPVFVFFSEPIDPISAKAKQIFSYS